MQPHQSMTDKVKNVLGVGHGTTHTTTDHHNYGVGSAPVVHHGTGTGYGTTTGTGYGTTTGTGYGTAAHTDGGMLERVGEAITGHGTHGTHGTGYDATGTDYGHTTGTGYGHTMGTGYGATGVGSGPAERQAGMLGRVEDAITGNATHGTGYGHTTGTGYGHTTGTGYGHTTGTGYGHTTGTGYGATGVGHGPAERQAGMLGRVEDAITGHGAHTTGTGYGTTTGTGYGHTTGTGVTHSSGLSLAEKAKLKVTGHL